MNEPSGTGGAGEDRGMPGLRGIDHVGITVPDIEEATAFFVDALGCELLYERDPPPDNAPQDTLGVPSGNRIAFVRSLRCANGANVELFEFHAPEGAGRDGFPRPSDFAMQHLAFYVDGLDAAAEHLRRHGAELLDGPNPLPGPEAGEGNRFIYARTPWGMTVELISYPSTMAYRRHGDGGAPRWKPPADR